MYIILGAFFHFIFELSGKNIIVGLFGAVNESVWEHIKIGFWPAFIWAIVEFFILGRKVKNFFIAKGISSIHDPISEGYGIFPSEYMNGWRF